MKKQFWIAYLALCIAFSILLMAYVHQRRKLIHTEALLNATVEECAEAWLSSPVSEEIKGKLK